MSTPTLPAGWFTILDEVHKRLDHAIALADERIAHIPVFDGSPVGHDRRDEIVKWNERLDRLSAYLESAEQVVHSVDETLVKEEALLRHDLAKIGLVRQRLAEGTGRAIG